MTERINRSVQIRFSIMMFLQYAIWGSWTTALGEQLQNKLGFTGAETSAIYGCLWLACIIAPFIGGQLVDRLIATQRFLGIAHLLGGVLLFMTAPATGLFSHVGLDVRLQSVLRTHTGSDQLNRVQKFIRSGR